MLDDLSQAPTEPIPQAEEVAENAPEQGSTQQQPQPEKPLTRDDVLALMREVIPQAVQPLIQSQVAKGENRINQRIAERFAALDREKGTLNLSDEQVTQARKAIIEDEQMKTFAPQPPQNAQGGEADTQSPEPMDAGQFIDSLKTRAFQLAGGPEVTPNDKEWAKIQAELDNPQGNPDLFVLAAVDASREKAQRLAAQKQKAPARVTGTGGESTPGDAPAKSSDDYWKKAHAKQN